MPITLQEANRRLMRVFRWIKHLLLTLSLIAVASPSVFAARPELVQLSSRGEVVQAYLLTREDTPVKAVVILVSGGFGLLKFQTTDSGVQWDQSGADFLVRNKDRFLDWIRLSLSLMLLPINGAWGTHQSSGKAPRIWKTFARLSMTSSYGFPAQKSS